MSKIVAIIATLFTLLILVAGCSTDAAPSECVQAAEDAGAPEAVVEWMKRPSDELGVIERVAIRKALEEFGLGDACSGVSANLDVPIADTAKTLTPSQDETDKKGEKPTPTPTSEPTPSANPNSVTRNFAQQSDYRIPERYEGSPEVAQLRHRGEPGDSSSAFVVIFDEPVYAEQHDEVKLTIYFSDESTENLELMTRTSRGNPRASLEFGPVPENLSRAISLSGYSYLRNEDGNSVEFDAEAFVNHPNALFIGPDYEPDLKDRQLARCAGVMEFNGVSPIVIKGLRDLDSSELPDTERYDWLTTLIDELEDAAIYRDRVGFDFHWDSPSLTTHPCAPLYSEEITEKNQSKRNEQTGCRSIDPDVAELIERPYLNLTATDRLVLRRELGGWGESSCVVHYPQLFLGVWLPLELELD